MRRLLAPRWLAWHALTLGVAVAFFRLGLWQWHRAVATGSPQNMGYALQWPAFALFAVAIWWRVARDAVRPSDAGAAAGPAKPGPPPRPGAGPRRPGHRRGGPGVGRVQPLPGRAERDGHTPVSEREGSQRERGAGTAAAGPAEERHCAAR